MDVVRSRALHRKVSAGVAVALGALSLTAVTALPASAATCANATITFDGDTNSFWDVAGNWDSNVLPSGSDLVCIPTGKTVVVRDASPVADAVAVDGVLDVTGTGKLTASTGYQTVTATNNGEIHVDATATIDAPVVAIQDDGVLVLAGGTLTGDLETSTNTSVTAWGSIDGELRDGGPIIVGQHQSTTARTLHVGGNLIFTPDGTFILDWLDDGGVAGVDYDLVQIIGNINYYAGTFEVDNPTSSKLGQGRSFTPMTYASESCSSPNVVLNGVPDVTLSVDVNATSTSIVSSGTPPVQGVAPDGYWLATADGQVLNYNAALHGSLVGQKLNAPIVDIIASPDNGGYWLVASDGGVFSFGDAGFFGSMANVHLNVPIVGAAAAPDGHGYYLVASDGGVFAFGTAEFQGSMADLHLNAPIVGAAADPDGSGYLLAASDGGVFAFDAAFAGSAGAQPLNRPVIDIAADPDGNGYWLAASDGGIFSYGAAFAGSAGGIHLNDSIVGVAANDDGSGYRLAGVDGGVFAFNAGFQGSAAGTAKTAGVVGIAGFGEGVDGNASSNNVSAAC